MKPFYLIFLLTAFLSCSKKEQKGIAKPTVYKSHETKHDTVTPVKIQDTLNQLTEEENTSIKKFVTRYKFSAFKVKMYTGKLADPNFEGNQFASDKEYVEFITEGCKNNGINFGGKYTIIHKSCGCMCEHIFIVDRSNGEIFVGAKMPLADSGDGRFGYTYQKDSKMIIADSGLFSDYEMKYYTCRYETAPEIYVWQSKRFKKLQ